MPVRIPPPPYWAVIFSSQLRSDEPRYAEMADRMVRLAQTQPGFLGVESARNEVGITVSYWRDLASIQQWKMHIEHQEAQRLGHEKWYATFKTRIAKVERDYGF